jgi:hypothetical protein
LVRGPYHWDTLYKPNYPEEMKQLKTLTTLLYSGDRFVENFVQKSALLTRFYDMERKRERERERKGVKNGIIFARVFDVC